MQKSFSSVQDLAVLGAQPVFADPRPNSGLFRPSRERFLEYAKSIFENRQLTNNGPLVRELEKRLAAMHGTKRCVTFCSGFMTLAIAMRAMGRRGGHEVIMPSATYRKMTDIVRWAGFTPFYVDIDPTTLGMAPHLVEPYISEKTALVLAAHPVVNTCDIAGLEALCDKYGIPLLVDAVEAAYGDIGGRKIGNFGDAEVFSTHASKFINGFEGGYLTSNSDALADKVRRMRAFGFDGYDNIVDFGCNAKLNEIHAAMILACLDDIDVAIDHNMAVFSAYKKALAGLPVRLIEYDSANLCTWRNIVICLQDEWPFSRDETLWLLNAENMLSRAYYSPLLHSDGVGTKFPSAPLPVSINVSNTHIILPSGAHVSPDDAALIGKFLHFIFLNAGTVLKALEEFPQ